MRTSAMRCPLTSKRRAVPGTISSTVASRKDSAIGAPPLMLQLLDDRVPQPPRQRADGKPGEDVVEEPEHDQSFGFGGRDPTRFEVVELVVVDRSDGRRVRAADVVRFDLEVRDRLGT